MVRWRLPCYVRLTRTMWMPAGRWLELAALRMTSLVVVSEMKEASSIITWWLILVYCNRVDLSSSGA